jgi:hypothetical protein
MTLLVRQLSPTYFFIPLKFKYSPRHSVLKHLVCVPPLMSKFTKTYRTQHQTHTQRINTIRTTGCEGHGHHWGSQQDFNQSENSVTFNKTYFRY